MSFEKIWCASWAGWVVCVFSISIFLSLAMSIKYCCVWFRNVVSVISSGLSCQYQTFMPWLVL